MALALGCLLGKVFGGFGGFWRVWRVLVWKVLEGLEGLEGFGGCLEGLEGFGGFGGLGGFWRVFGGFGGFWSVWRVLEGFGGFGVFAGWQTAALKANRKPLLWPWPWGACWGSGLGPGVPAGQGVWRVWTVLEGFGGWSDRTSSTPAVVPGAAPALAKAGVGGFAVEPVCLPTSWKPSKTVRSRLSFSAGSSLQALTDELA